MAHYDDDYVARKKAIMKTVIIYDQCGQDKIKFYVVPGDYTHLDGIYVNHDGHSEGLRDELANLFYDEKTGEELLIAEPCFPYDEICEGGLVIVAGFLP